jgi:hypothetical protein
MQRARLEYQAIRRWTSDPLFGIAGLFETRDGRRDTVSRLPWGTACDIRAGTARDPLAGFREAARRLASLDPVQPGSARAGTGRSVQLISGGTLAIRRAQWVGEAQHGDATRSFHGTLATGGGPTHPSPTGPATAVPAVSDRISKYTTLSTTILGLASRARAEKHHKLAASGGFPRRWRRRGKGGEGSRVAGAKPDWVRSGEGCRRNAVGSPRGACRCWRW